MAARKELSGIDDVLKECGVTESTLSGAEKEALDRAGYVLLPDVIDSPWLGKLRTAFESAIDQEQTTPKEKQTGTRHGSDLIQKDPAFHGVLTHPKILAAVYHVLRRSFKVFVLGGRDPLPGYGLQGFHTDWYPRASLSEPFSVVTAIWLLDDFIVNNGATRLIPESHLTIQPLSKSMLRPESNHPDQKIITARAASVLVFNGHLWHSGTRNGSNSSRRVLQCQFVARELVRPAESQPSTFEHLPSAARYILGV